MDKLEKAERLRERANVTYEEAMEALDAAGGDLLDAMVLLEQQGKVKRPEQSSYSTEYAQQKEYIDVPDRVEQQKRSAPSFQGSLAAIFHGVIKFIRNTSFKVSRQDKEIFVFPLWLIVLVLLFTWKITLPIGIIALIFGFRYSFEGSEDTTTANIILSKAGQIADDVKSGLSAKNAPSAGSHADPHTGSMSPASASPANVSPANVSADTVSPVNAGADIVSPETANSVAAVPGTDNSISDPER